ncbi:MAG: hypothetical protein OEO79_07435 [Gemmatimonadota bacterium]|nr:hypothetical protein [Gemmatimonadota bacterium]
MRDNLGPVGTCRTLDIFTGRRSMWTERVDAGCGTVSAAAKALHLIPEEPLNRSLIAACAVAAVLAAPRAVSAQSQIEGSWAFTLDSPEGAFEIPLTITREEGQLIARLPTGEDFFTGTETPSGVSFSWPLVYQDMDLPTTLTGSFQDGKWSGLADFGGLATGTWEAIRAP